MQIHALYRARGLSQAIGHAGGRGAKGRCLSMGGAETHAVAPVLASDLSRDTQVLPGVTSSRRSATGETRNRGGAPLGHGAKPLSINQRPISLPISSRHLSFQKDSFTQLTSAMRGVPPAMSRSVTVCQPFLKNLSRSAIGILRPYPAPLPFGQPLFHAVAMKASRVKCQAIPVR